MLSQDRLVIGSYHYFRYPLEHFLGTAQELGFSWVDLWAAAPHLDPLLTDSARLAEVKEALESRGLRPWCITLEQVNYPVNLAAAEELLRRHTLCYYRAAIDMAAALNAPWALVTAGCGYYNQPPQAAWERSRTAVEQLAQYAAQRDVGLLYETLTPPSSNLVNTPRQLRDMLDGLPGNVRGVVDFGQVAHMGQSLQDYIDLLGDRLAHVHLQDRGAAIHMALGDGDLPLEQYLDLLEQSGYTGRYSFEFNDQRYRREPDRADRQSLEWMRSHGYLA